MKLKILDLFCGAGGAAMGMHRYFPQAEIIGVDLRPQKHYPFAFEQADAMTYPLSGYDFIWASPPCQGYSVMRHLPWNREREYPLLIEPMLARLEAHGAPYLLENVAGAKTAMPNAGWLCGTMFGKRFYRHRLFASNFLWLAPSHPAHVAKATVQPDGQRGTSHRGGANFFLEVKSQAKLRGMNAHFRARVEKGWSVGVGHQPQAAKARQEMEVEWMTADEMSQAVPPCYSEYLAQFIPYWAAAEDVT